MADGQVVHVRIAARDPRRAAAFYVECFGWRLLAEDAAGVRFEAPGGLRGCFWSGGEPSSAGPELHVAVHGIEQVVKQALARGALRIARIGPGPEGGRLALLLDPEGNRIGVWEAAADAEASPGPTPRR